MWYDTFVLHLEGDHDTKYAIYGAGSLGTVLGAYLCKAGVDIELVNRNEAHVQALNKYGAVIGGTVQMTVPVRAILPGQMEGRYDVIFLMTKQLENREVAAFLKPFLSPAGGIVTMEFDPETLQSRIVPGLYAAGEVLDVDGDCGGFNLQWAFASALMAADGIDEALSKME